MRGQWLLWIAWCFLNFGGDTYGLWGNRMKLKWQYDKQFKQWWVQIDRGDGFLIEKETNCYVLTRDYEFRQSFSLLKNAKKVAQLLYNG